MAEAFFFVAMLSAASDLAPPDRRGEAINLGVARPVPRAGLRAAARRGGPGRRRLRGRLDRAPAALAGAGGRPRDPAARDVAGRRRRDRRARRGRACSTRRRSFPGVLVCAARSGWPGSSRSSRSTRARSASTGPALPLARLRADRRRAPLRLRQAARPGRRGRAVGRRARGRGRRAWRSRRCSRARSACVVGTAVFAAGVAFVFPALLVAGGVARRRDGARRRRGHDERVPRRLVRRRARRVRRRSPLTWGYGGAFLLGAAVAALRRRPAGGPRGRRSVASDPGGVRSGA